MANKSVQLNVMRVDCKSGFWLAATAAMSIIAFSVASKFGAKSQAIWFAAWRIQRNSGWQEVCNAISTAFPETRYAFMDEVYFARTFAIDASVLAENNIAIVKSNSFDRVSAARLLKAEFGDVWK